MVPEVLWDAMPAINVSWAEHLVLAPQMLIALWDALPATSVPLAEHLVLAPQMLTAQQRGVAVLMH